MTNINELNDAWIESGNKVEELDNKINTALLDENTDVKAVAELKAQRDNAIAKRDMLKDQLTEARKNAKTVAVDGHKGTDNNNKANKKNVNAQFVQDIKDMACNRITPHIENMMVEGGSNGNDMSMLVPEDINVQIRELMRQYFSLQSLVRVENTTVNSGSRVIEKLSAITPLTKVTDGETIPANDDPAANTIHYAINEFGGISTMTNSLLKDSPDNIVAWVTRWVAHKSMVTRNNAILAVLPTLPGAKTPTLKTMDDVRKLILTGVDPAIATTSSIVTNQSGFAALANLKDGVGQYYLNTNAATGAANTILGKKVIVVADKWLPDVAGNHPFYYGDMSQAVTLFDREQMSLTATNIGGTSFNTNTTQLRVIDRFDVEAIDTEALVPATFNDTIASTSAKA